MVAGGGVQRSPRCWAPSGLTGVSVMPGAVLGITDTREGAL